MTFAPATDAKFTNLFVKTIVIVPDGGGATVDTVDFTAQAQGTRSFVTSGGRTVTVNQSADTAAMPTRWWHADTTYLWQPGSNGNYSSVAEGSTPSLDILGDISVELDFELVSTAVPGGTVLLLSKWNGTGNQRSYSLEHRATTGKLRWNWSEDGASALSAESDAALSTIMSNNTRMKLKVTFDVDNGAVGNDVKFWYRSSDASAWTQFGTTKTTAGVTSIFNSSSPFECGSTSGGYQSLYGRIYKCKIWASVDDTDQRLDADFTRTDLYNSLHTTLTAVSGQAVTINRSATGLKTTVVYENTEADDGVDDYCSTDNHARLNFAATGSLSIAKRIRVFATPAAEGVLAGKKSGVATANAGYQITIDTSRRAVFRVTDGTNIATSTSAALTVGQDYVIVGVLNRLTGQVIVYINGVAATAGDASAVGDLTNTVDFRSSSGGAGANFSACQNKTGELFRRALSQGQILSLNREM